MQDGRNAVHVENPGLNNPEQAPVCEGALVTLRPALRTGVLIVGHGSRELSANAEFELLVSAFKAAHSDLDIAHGYVELAQPALSEALVALGRRNNRVITIPLFLLAAGHLKNDIPLALAEARRHCPDVQFEATRALGIHRLLIEVAFERAAAVCANKRESKTAAIIVGRGASDPDANSDFYKLVRLFGEGRGFTWVLPSFIGITTPSFEDAAELVIRSRPDRVVVVPYFLYAGRLLAKLQSQVESFAARYSWIRMELAAPIGNDSKLIDVLDERLQEALEGARPLPCDTCQYRTPISGLAGHVGGLRALLWSIRHGFTHTQAVPHIHAHRPMSKHVLVCENVDCAARGSIALISAIRRLIKAAGRERDIRVTRTGCMGRCGEGPTVAVYPDGIWYRGVQESDATALVNEHLFNDRLVARLVDNIMQ